MNLNKKSINMRIFTLIIMITACIHNESISQTTFKTIRGSKAIYSISVPSNYQSKEAIGANIDIKYVNSEGASIVTVVKKVPSSFSGFDISAMTNPSDYEVVQQLESNGMQNITIIKRGMILINGIRTYYAYYQDLENYYHTINQIRKGKLINVTYTCNYSKKETYMPYIFRVINSLK